MKSYLGEFHELILLAILFLDNNAYGVPIAEAIENATGKRVSTGALYTALGRLEEKKFICSWIGESTSERGGRAKKYFQVIEGGETALKDARDIRAILRRKI